MTIVNALKKLITAWGGSTTADTIADAIDDLSAVTPSSLPEVSSTDNGDVLTVVEGTWAKATPSGGLPAVTGSDNGDVLSVQNGAWAKAEFMSMFYETKGSIQAFSGQCTSDVQGESVSIVDWISSGTEIGLSDVFSPITVTVGEAQVTFPKSAYGDYNFAGVTQDGWKATIDQNGALTIAVPDALTPSTPYAVTVSSVTITGIRSDFSDMILGIVG